MGWAIAVAALGVAFIIVGGALALRAFGPKRRPVAIPLSPDAGILVAGLGAGMLVFAFGLLDKLR
jgi:hypothetical protein